MIYGYFTYYSIKQQYVRYIFLVHIFVIIYNNQTMEIQNDIFKKGNIQSVVFDLDDTLFLTNEYYKKEIIESAEYVLDRIGDSVNTTQTILDAVSDNHKKGGRPQLLNILIENTLNSIYGEELEDREEIFEHIDKRIEKFYLNVPKLRPYALEVLEYIDSKEIPIGIYSHAQNDWTERKVQYIQKEYFGKYGKEIEIKSYSTPLDREKDTQGWRDALIHFGFIPENTLVVGDNMKSDIIPAQELGVKNLILLTSMYSDNGKLESSNGVIRMEKIETILTL